MAATPVQSPASCNAESAYFVFNTDGKCLRQLTHIFDKFVTESDLGYHLFVVEENLADCSVSIPLLYEKKRTLENGVSYKRSYMPLRMAGLEEAYHLVIGALDRHEQRIYLPKKGADHQDQ